MRTGPRQKPPPITDNGGIAALASLALLESGIRSQTKCEARCRHGRISLFSAGKIMESSYHGGELVEPIARRLRPLISIPVHGDPPASTCGKRDALCPCGLCFYSSTRIWHTKIVRRAETKAATAANQWPTCQPRVRARPCCILFPPLPAARKSYGERYVKSKIAKFAGRHQSRPIEFRWNQILAWISEIGLEFFF
jgi:hypothetical protein